MQTIGIVLAALTLIATVLGFQLLGRRRLYVRPGVWSLADATETPAVYRTEVTAQLITHGQTVMIEGVSIRSAKRIPGPWVLDSMPGAAPDDWPPPWPNSPDGVRMEPHSTRSWRLGSVGAPRRLIDPDGTIELRVVALLARPSTTRRRPAWVHKASKRLAERKSRPFRVQATPREDGLPQIVPPAVGPRP